MRIGIAVVDSIGYWAPTWYQSNPIYFYRAVLLCLGAIPLED